MNPVVAKSVRDLLEVANDLHAQNQFQEALEKRQRALALCQGETFGLPYGLMEGLLNLTGLRQQLDEAPEQQDELTALCQHSVGVSYYSLGDFGQAFQFFQQSLETLSRLYPNQDHSDVAISLSNVGGVSLMQGNTGQALEYFTQALEMQKRLYPEQDHPGVANCMGKIGSAYSALGAVNQALEFFEQALEMYKRLYPEQDHPDVSNSLLSTGLSYLDLGKIDQALKYVAQALEIRERLYPNLDHPDVAESLSSLGRVYRIRGDAGQAFQCFEQALEIYRRLYQNQDHPDIATSLNNLGFAYRSLGATELALEFYRDALEMHKRLYPDQDHPGVAGCLNNVGHAYHAQGETRAAVQALFDGLEMQERLDRRNWFGMVDTEGKLRVIDRTKPHLNAVLSLLTAYQQLPHVSSAEAQPLIAQAYQLIMRRHNLELEMRTTLRMIQLSDRYPEYRDTFQELQEAYKEQARWGDIAQRFLTEEVRQEVSEEIHRWEDRERDLLGQLNGIPEIRAQEQRVQASAATVASQLPPSCALLQFVHYRRIDSWPKKANASGTSYYGVPEECEVHYGIFILRPGESIPTFLDLGEAVGIEAALHDYLRENDGIGQGRSSGIDEDEEADLPMAAAKTVTTEMPKTVRDAFLTHPFWEPLKSYISNMHHLIVVPDGALSFAPFNRIFADVSSVLYLTTGSELVIAPEERPATNSRETVLLGDPHYGLSNQLALAQNRKIVARRSKKPDSIVSKTPANPINSDNLRDIDRTAGTVLRLPGTRLEANCIAKILGAEPLVWEQATVQAVERVSAPRLLYIPTHFKYVEDLSEDANPLHYCGIVLAGARSLYLGRGVPAQAIPCTLTAYHAATRLDLRGTVVVLPACSAARGVLKEGRMVRGLRSALLWAGARTLILPLWKVDDLATAIFMEHFMRQLIEKRLSITEALSQAQEYLKTATVASLQANWFNDDTDTELATLEAETTDEEDREPVTALRNRLNHYRSQPDTTCPFADERYWAAFVCVGDPSPIMA